MTSKYIQEKEGGADAGLKDECECTEPTSINPELTEDIAVVYIAEGWSLAIPPTRERLEHSYYRKAFRRINKKQIPRWNFAAFIGTPFWLLYHKMYLEAGAFLVLSVCLGMACELWDISSPMASIPIAMGVSGNDLLLNSAKRRVKKGYHLCQNYNGTSRSYFVYSCIAAACAAVAPPVLKIDPELILGYLLFIALVIPFPIVAIIDKINIRKMRKGINVRARQR
ncbi:MAG: DUF2628 domain-containing protein [Holosporales bacterium]|jgi:hypothetical protein|nr:DUF2628 domain-containing protein [Holosporales bacterium]